ncbi:uracil phosphoribosyltransferase [Streptomyces noursei ZPM]|nr:uracil phosphoribosyltransferase [Streptomyces noursei ZPM]
MRIHVVDHPLVAHKLTTLRDKRTDSPTFRRLADELVTLLAYEATRDVRTEQVDIETPVTATTGVRLSHPRPMVVPILRAGLGMLDGMVRLLPTAEVGFMGMVRNEETYEAHTYATRMPDDLSGRQVYVVDPMLATGGTLVAAIKELIKRGADDVTAICLLAAPEGVEVMERELAGTPVTVVFRRLADELVTLLAYEATRDVRTEQVDIETPVTATTGVRLSHPRPMVVPILRAGLGMLDGMVRLLPTAEVGFMGMVRNEETYEAHTYATRMPDDLSGRQVYVVDPMLATGGTLVAAIKELIKRGADDVTAICLLAAPEGVEVMERELAGTPVTVVTAAVDEQLNADRYIVPGLGDAGDRMYGTAG